MKMQSALLMVLAGMLTAFSQENYTTWPYYKNIKVNTSASGANVTGNVVKFPVLVRLGAGDNLSGITPQNIRFTKADGVTRLSHQLERFDSTLQMAEAWVLMDTVYGNDTAQSIRMYWGKSGVADSSNGAAVFDTANGFQAVWHLGEATDSTAKDATVNNFVGTPGTTGTAGNPFDTAGAIGKAKSFRVTTFSGGAGTAGAFYSIAGSATGKLNFPEGSIYTLSAWIRAYDIVNSGKILSKGDRQYYLSKRNTGSSWEFAENKAATGQNRWRLNSVANQWKYMVGVRLSNATGAAGGAMYIDGSTSGTAFSTSGASANINTDIVNIGRDPNQGGAANYYFTGGIDEVAISSVARSANWIKLSFETQKPTATAVALGATINNLPGFPAITSHPANRAATAGSTVKFGVVANGAATLVYKWVRRNVDTVGTNSDSLTLANISAADTGSYKCVVRNSVGQVISNSATLTLQVAPAITSQPVTSQAMLTTGTVRFGITASGVPAPTYKWIRQRGVTSDTLVAGGVFSFNTRGDTLIITNATIADTGLYRCRAVNAAGAAVSNDGRLLQPVAIRQVSGGSGMMVRNTGSSLLFLLPEKVSSASVSVIDTWGRTVWSGDFEKGRHELSWNWTGQNGRAVAKGVYVARMVLQSGSKSSVLEKQVQYGP